MSLPQPTMPVDMDYQFDLPDVTVEAAGGFLVSSLGGIARFTAL